VGNSSVSCSSSSIATVWRTQPLRRAESL
jgi:hypothetical protein